MWIKKKLKQISLKPRIKSTGKSWPTASKDGLGVNDAESASRHEDDALFGDLFSEASRQVVLSLVFTLGYFEKKSQLPTPLQMKDKEIPACTDLTPLGSIHLPSNAL